MTVLIEKRFIIICDLCSFEMFMVVKVKKVTSFADIRKMRFVNTLSPNKRRKAQYPKNNHNYCIEETLQNIEQSFP